MDHLRREMIIVIVLIGGQREEIIFQSVNEMREKYPENDYRFSRVGRLVYITKA